MIAVDAFMSRALALAECAHPICPPNPAVGCVLVGADGVVIGEGHTQPTGHAHAEVMALRAAAQGGHDTRGATAYVTLEPCAHQGRTGPCADALVGAGVRRVVAALQDPNPRVAGQGFARLRAAGVDVVVGPGAQAARELNLGFFSRMQRGVPWVRLKIAASLDGRTALPDGTSQWITGPVARTDGHRWRARAGAVLTGIGTVLHDNPQLNVRLPEVQRQPLLAIVDSQLRTPPGAALWSVADRPVRIYTTRDDTHQADALRACGAAVVSVPGAGGRVDLPAVLRDLARLEINEAHVEAGSGLNGALLQAALVDELLIYQAPILLGEGLGLASLGPLTRIAQGVPLQFMGAEPIGADLRVLARVAGRSDF